MAIFRAKVEDYLIEFFRFPDWTDDTAGRDAKRASLHTFRTNHPNVTASWPAAVRGAAMGVAATGGGAASGAQSAEPME